jgi:hypothetical protein
MTVPVALGQIALIVACALALCSYVGWGATALGLPASLRPFAALLSPLIGYAITIWLGYMGASTVLNLRWALALLLLLASALNLLAWRRGARPRPIAALGQHLAPLALLLVTLLVGVLPLLRYGYLTAIGQGWDTESYLPMAQHLIDYPLARIPDAPLSPLRDLVRDPPRIGVTLGFSVFQGMAMLLSGQSALATFAPLLALLRAFGILAIYVWLRATMGLGRSAALLGSAGASAGALLLWVGYFNFAMQMSAWPLLALGLLLGVAAVEELASPRTFKRSTVQMFDRLPVLLLTAITLAALPVAYYPALTIWAPMAAGLGAARLLEALLNPRPLALSATPGSAAEGAGRWRVSVRLFIAALALGVVALALAAPTIRDYYAGFSFRYSLPAQHIGPDRFIAPAETLGLLAFRLPNGGPQPPAALVAAGLALLALLALAGLAFPTKDEGPWTKDQRASIPSSAVLRHSFMPWLRWLAVAGAVLAYLAWLRFGRPYEYAYMKGSAYAGFVGWGLAALGWQSLRARLGRAGHSQAGSTRWRFRLNPQLPIALLALAPLLLAGWAQALTIADHWGGPAIFVRDIAAVDSAAAQLPPGAAVAITSDGAFTGPISGQLSAALYGHEIWGHLSTAYTSFDYWPAGRTPPYALLAADEWPWPLALGGQELWRSGAVALYRLDSHLRVLQGRDNFYSPAPPTDRSSPAALALWRRAGAYRLASHDAPLQITLGDTLAFDPGSAQGTARDQDVRLTVASLAAQTVTIGAGARQEHVALGAGVSRIDLRLATPAELTITPDDRLALIDVVARDPAAATTPGVQLDSGQIAWNAAAEQRGPTTSLRVELANPGRRALRIGLTIVEDTFDAPHQPLRLLAAAPIEGTWQLQIDLARGATQALVDKTPTPLLTLDAGPNPPDGNYFGVLTLYDGEQPIISAPVFRLSYAAGQVNGFEATPFTVEATPAGGMAEPLPSNERALLADARALDDGAAALDGALLWRRPPWPGAGRDTPLRAGDRLTIQLGWHAQRDASPPLMVSLQLLGADDHKWSQWDGPLGGDWRPIQGWHAGERTRQDVPLTLDPATPPGTYRLLLIVYNPADGQPQPFGGQNELPLGEVLVQ